MNVVLKMPHHATAERQSCQSKSIISRRKATTSSPQETQAQGIGGFWWPRAFLISLSYNTRKHKKGQGPRYPRQIQTHTQQDTRTIDPTFSLPNGEDVNFSHDQSQAREDNSTVAQGVPMVEGKVKEKKTPPRISKESSAHFLSFHVQEGEFGLGRCLALLRQGSIEFALGSSCQCLASVAKSVLSMRDTVAW